MGFRKERHEKAHAIEGWTCGGWGITLSSVLVAAPVQAIKDWQFTQTLHPMNEATES